jgi:hypothetical protein
MKKETGKQKAIRHVFPALTEKSKSNGDPTWFAFFDLTGKQHVIETDDKDLISFLKKVDFTEDGRWLWKASKSSGGYPFFRGVSAHRWLYMRWYRIETLPKSFDVCHLDHDINNLSPFNLFTATHGTNIQHSAQSGRMNSKKPRLTTQERIVLIVGLMNAKSVSELAHIVGRRPPTVYRFKENLKKTIDSLSENVDKLEGSQNALKSAQGGE